MQRRGSAFDLGGLALVAAVVAWLAGILLEAAGQAWMTSWAQIPTTAFLVCAIVAFACAIVSWRQAAGGHLATWRLIALLAGCLLLGAWRYATVSPVADPTAIRAYTGTKALEVTGSIADEPRLEGRSTLLDIDTQQVSLDKGQTWQNAHGRIEVIVPGSLLDDPYSPRYGDVVQLQGTLQAPSPNSSPEVFASMTFPRLSIQQSGGNPFIAALYQLRTMLALIIERSLPQPLAALLIALVLSLRTPVLLPLIPIFNATGTAHLIAPSGLKITILAGVIGRVGQHLLARGRRRQGQPSQFRPLLPAEQRRRKLRQIPVTTLVIASIVVYTFLSGGGPAAMRAGIMGIILVLAPRQGRFYNVYTALAFSALLLSALDPFVLWDASFQLSFLGTLGIVLLTPLWMRLFHRLERFWFGAFIAETIAVTLAAEIATLPIFALTFHTISLIAPLTNILTVPLLTALILLGLLLCVSGLIALPIALVVGWLLWPLLWYVNAILTWCAQVPYASLSVPKDMNVIIVWVYYVPLTLVFNVLRRWPLTVSRYSSGLLSGQPYHQRRLSRRTRIIIQAGAALVLLLVSGTTAFAEHTSPQVTITFLNVGPAGQPAQGEAILVRTPDNKAALIDGGPDAASLANALDSRLPFWQRSLNLVMLTAPRQDNLVGLEDVVTRYAVGEVVDAGMLHPNASYARFINLVNQRGLSYYRLRQGAVFSLGAYVTFQVFWPASPLHKSSQEDEDNGMVVRILAPGLRLLLLGDAALSKYALQDGLLSTINPSYLAADVVQMVGDASKAPPAALGTLLAAVHPSLIVVTPGLLSAKLRKAGSKNVLASLPFASSAWQIVQTAQAGTFELSTGENGWSAQAS
jgi:competence protein ComEC